MIDRRWTRCIGRIRRPGRANAAPRCANRFARATLLALSTVLASGCSDYLKKRELAAVAKDWSLVIRASQVIPVYPLTEDLQPGDLFLVLRSIPEQVDEYTKSGFLPLDQHITRLGPFDYATHYQESYGTKDRPVIPRDYQFPSNAAGTPATPERDASSSTPPDGAAATATADATPAGGEESGDDAGDNSSEPATTTDWKLAPRAAFPSYNFSVKSGGALGLAMPIQGVPVALSLMQADQATGSVTISDAYTYGLPFQGIATEVYDWARQPLHRSMLANLRREVVNAESCWSRAWRWLTRRPEPTIYVRAVNRVYLTQGIVVQVNASSSGGADIAGGAPKDVQIPGLEDQKTAENYANALEQVSKKIDSTLPGGELKLAWATSRSVSLSENFERPLVVGYLAFDFPVLPDGSLGVPIATRDQLQRGSSDVRVESAVEEYGDVLEEIESLPEARRSGVYEKAATALGTEFKALYDKERASLSPGEAFTTARRRHSFGKSVDAAHYENALRTALRD